MHNIYNMLHSYMPFDLHSLFGCALSSISLGRSETPQQQFAHSGNYVYVASLACSMPQLAWRRAPSASVLSALNPLELLVPFRWLLR